MQKLKCLKIFYENTQACFYIKWEDEKYASSNELWQICIVQVELLYPNDYQIKLIDVLQVPWKCQYVASHSQSKSPIGYEIGGLVASGKLLERELSDTYKVYD